MSHRRSPVLLLLLALAPPACADDEADEQGGPSAGPRRAAPGEPEAERAEPRAAGRRGGGRAAGEASLSDLPEISREREVLWDSESSDSSREVVWRPDPQTAVALSVRKRGSGESVTASVQASLGGRLPATVYRCTELDARAGARVAIQLDAEETPHILCEERGGGDAAGSTFGVRLSWDGERRAVVPSGTWNAPRAGVSPDEALRAARDAGPAADAG